MITIYVDYQGDKSEQTYKFTDFGDEYLEKLSELESYPGKIDKVMIFTDKEALVNTTNVGSAVRQGRVIASRIMSAGPQ